MTVESTLVAWGAAEQLHALARAGDSALPYSEGGPSLTDHGAYVSIEVRSPSPPEIWLDMQTEAYDALYWVARWAGPGRARGVFGARGRATAPWWEAFEPALDAGTRADVSLLCLAALPELGSATDAVDARVFGGITHLG